MLPVLPQIVYQAFRPTKSLVINLNLFLSLLYLQSTEKEKNISIHSNISNSDKMVEFETTKSIEIPFGKNNFIEITRKVTREPESQYAKYIKTSKISITLGYQIRGGRKYTTSIGIPDDNELLKNLSKALSEF